MNASQRTLLSAFGRRLPPTRGSMTLRGLEGPVTIRRDAWGVPHISARSDHDAWFALGFCQAQDRAFQLETLVRVVRGTTAALVGAEALPLDRLSRRVGFYRAAERQLGSCSPALRAMLGAFACGINAGATSGSPRRAHEFALLRARPTPWGAVDVLGHLKLISFLLATNWDVELARLKILQEDGPDALRALDPAYPEWQPVISPPGAVAGPAVDRLAEDLGAFLSLSGVGGGSNNWALAASRTTTGRPILANDPHLAPTLPPHWYLAHITTPEWSLAGASFTGLPAVAGGHNGHAAWGVTVGMTDNADLYIEEVGPDGRSVRQGDGFVPCEVRVERIQVKGGADVTERVLITPRGPIIEPVMEGELGAVSLQAVWLQPLPADSIFQLHRARSFADLHELTAAWPALPLSIAYADTSGAIGWQLVGQAPQRRKGFGAVPLAGWDAGAGWEADMVPHDAMPHVVGPEIGLVVTANNKPVRDGDGPFLTVDPLEGYRAARILQALQARPHWDLDATAALQMDVVSLPWLEMRELVLGVPDTDPGTRRAIELLRDWDGRVAVDSPAAAVFELFVGEICTRVARSKAPRGWPWVMGRGFHPLVVSTGFGARRIGHLIPLLREQPTGWFERSWEDELADCLATAVQRLEAEYGPAPSAWAWGKIRRLMLVHPFGRRKPFDRIFNLGPYSWGGDSNTIAQASVDPVNPTVEPSFIQSLRMAVDVGAWENARFVLPGGQSGNPLSPHYADQLPLWLRGEGIPIPWSDRAVAAAARETLYLTPPG